MKCRYCGGDMYPTDQSCTRCGASTLAADGYAVSAGSQHLPTQADAGLLFAGFWRRAAAAGLDYFIILIATLVVLRTPVVNSLLYDFAREFPLLAAVVPTVIWWVYYTITESSELQASLGKLAVGIKVVDNEGWRISTGRAFLRYGARIISALVLLIGYLVALFTEQKRTLHDILVGTLVVHRAVPNGTLNPAPLDQREGTGWMVASLILMALLPVAFSALLATTYNDYTARRDRVARVPEERERRALPQSEAEAAGEAEYRRQEALRAAERAEEDRKAAADAQTTAARSPVPEVAAAVKDLAPLRKRIEGHYTTKKFWPRTAADIGSEGKEREWSDAGFVYLSNGTVVLAFGETAHPAIRYLNIALHPEALPDGRILWSCSPLVERSSNAAKRNTTIPREAVPRNCGL